jgi:Fe-S oxidoreductase
VEDHHSQIDISLGSEAASRIKVTEKRFCQCCGMQLRLTPSEGEYKEKMRENLITNKKKAAGRNNSPGSGS